MGDLYQQAVALPFRLFPSTILPYWFSVFYVFSGIPSRTGKDFERGIRLKS
jgi:hypothetical protein